MSVRRDTIRISQNTAVRMPTSPADLLPTPDVLDPGSEDEDRTDSR
jgi:hypothetical protein